MSQRTLTRRLQNEGTSFSVLLDDMRHGLALRYITQSDLTLTEVALLSASLKPPHFIALQALDRLQTDRIPLAIPEY